MLEDDSPLRRAVYLVGSAFTGRDHERFGIPLLRARGIEVTVLDVSALVHPAARQDNEGRVLDFDCAVRTLRDETDLAVAMPMLARADVIFALFTDGTVTRHGLPVLKALARTATPVALLCDSAQPGINNYKGEMRSLPKRLADIARRLLVIDPRDSLIARTPLPMLGLKPARFAIYGGHRSRRATQLIGPRTQAIWAHALDYDRFLAEHKTPAPDESIAVFIDQDLPHHRDWVLLKGHGVGDADAYYRGLNCLFARIEAELGLKVVIAAHPRALGRSERSPFAAYKMIAGQTLNLVRRARLVMTFTSQASHFAVLARKPLLVLTMRAFHRSPAGARYVEPLARETGSRPLFLEEVESWRPAEALVVDHAAYGRYVENYIKMPGTPERPLWEIALDTIEGALVQETSSAQSPAAAA